MIQGPPSAEPSTAPFTFDPIGFLSYSVRRPTYYG